MLSRKVLYFGDQKFHILGDPGWLAGARGNKSGKEMKRRRFSSKEKKAEAFSALLVKLRR